MVLAGIDPVHFILAHFKLERQSHIACVASGEIYVPV